MYVRRLAEKARVADVPIQRHGNSEFYYAPFYYAPMRVIKITTPGKLAEGEAR